MKWIKPRHLFLEEAKIKDVILPKQAKEIEQRWGAKYLDYDEIEATDKIKQGKWKLSNEDKYEVLGAFTECDIYSMEKLFHELPSNFVEVINNSVDTDILTNKDFKRIMENFNIQNPSLDQIIIIFDPVFRKISTNETLADNMISKDENGRPIKDEEGNMIRVQKEKGDVVYTNNLINILSFISDYTTLSSKIDKFDSIDIGTFSDKNLRNFISYAKDSSNREYHVDFEIFNRDIYLSITHNPKDILNMSISKFYSSCQHLYSGGYSSQLLGNVFDPNSIPAFLVFDTPIFVDDEKISDQLPLSRMIIRNIEDLEDKGENLFFDRAYPDRMKDVFNNIIEKYSDNINSNVYAHYTYRPDIDSGDSELPIPYHDRLDIKVRKTIGVNTKTLYINRLENWEDVKVSKNNKIKEIIIETTNLPSNLLDLKLELDWIKFRGLELKSLVAFNNITCNNLSLDRCKFDSSIFDKESNIYSDIEKLQIISCDNKGVPNLTQLDKLTELHLIYTLDSDEDLEECIKGLNLKKLVISGDLVTKKTKPFISSLRNKGIKVETIGPVI